MNHLKHLNKYFWKYRWRFFLGIIFIIISNYFGILAPQLTGYVVDEVQRLINPNSYYNSKIYFDPLVLDIIRWMKGRKITFGTLILITGMMLLFFALLKGFFMFLMRQTIIVMSRKIEYDQKNEVFDHYQKLDMLFYKKNAIGDLMSRISEDVSRVRMYTGPALMYLVNLIVLIGFSLFYMFKKDPLLSAYVLVPLPLLAVAMYFVNKYIIKKSESIQAQLSELTTIAQESYSGIRVIKSFFQEKNIWQHFDRHSEKYRKSGLALSTVESVYFPAIGFLIGISTLLTIYIGCQYQLEHKIGSGTIAEFVVYINLLTFPVSSIGWVVSNIQRAAASQKRLNEFLQIHPNIQEVDHPKFIESIQEITFEHVNFTYDKTNIQAIKNFEFTIKKGDRIAIIGKSGCGKTTLAQLILRMMDVSSGSIKVNGVDIQELNLTQFRSLISYVPQDIFLFSDTIENNISFGCDEIDFNVVKTSANVVEIDKEIEQLSHSYQTSIGERGVMLSGGQKQRISIARAISKESDFYIFDDCISALDTNTEQKISQNMAPYLKDKTALCITHRVLHAIQFDKIIVMHDGQILQMGSHESLMAEEGYYKDLYLHQQNSNQEASTH